MIRKPLTAAIAGALALGLAGPVVAACSPCSPKKKNPRASAKKNPCAAKKKNNPCAAANPCASKNPCAAKKM